MCRSRLWRQASLSIGTPLGNLGESVCWELGEMREGGPWKWSISVNGSCVRGTWMGAPLLGTLKDMLRKALETGISLHRGPVGQPQVGSFTKDFEKWMKEGSGNGVSLSVGAL